LRLEVLEDRQAPAVLTVTNLSDHDPGSLRAQLGAAHDGDTINFQAGLSGTILLTTGPLTMRASGTLQGPGANVISISGNHRWYVLDTNFQSTGAISGLTFTAAYEPHTFYDGGAVRIFGTVTLTDCTISNSSGGNGAGIFNGGMLTVNNCTISGNSAAGGGGIDNQEVMTMNNCTISGNTAPDGGGIFSSARLTMNNCTVRGNLASDRGGGISSTGTLIVNNCTLSGNSAHGAGGGIFNFSILAVTNSTLSGNSSGDAGGGISSQDRMTLSSCTFTRNSALYGGGIDNSYGTPATLSNTIVAGNLTPEEDNGPDVVGSVNASSAYSLVGDGFGLSGIRDGVNHNQVGVANPGLGTLTDNGGPTRTVRLLVGSPALGAGYPVLAGSPDQRGVVRSTPVSIGAYQGLATVTAVTASAGTSVYGQSVTFTATVSAGSPVPGTVTFRDGSSTLRTVPLDGSGHASYTTAGLGAGSHTITAVYNGNSTCQPGSGSTSLTVSPAPLTITAYDKSKVAGDPLPTLTAGYAGFVNGDDVSNLSTPVSLSTYSGDTAGSYPIVPSGATAANYAITFANGTLTITPAAAASFQLSAPASVTAGQRLSLTVTALDPYGNVDPSYVGTVNLSSSDLQAATLGSYTFTTADAGVYTFIGLQLFTAGSQSIFATDGNLSGEADLTVTPDVAASLMLSGPARATAGVPFQVIVTAYDAWGNIATGYLGTVTFTCTDAAATLPANYPFQPGDQGTQNFPVTLLTSGTQRLTVTDTANPSLTAFLDVTV
jgi:hypothetical protein